MDRIHNNTQRKERKKKEDASNNKRKELAFDTSFSIDISEKDVRRLPRSPLYMETICAADLMSKDDKEAVAKIREMIGDDATNELVMMSSDKLENEIKEVMDGELPDNSILEGVMCRCYIEGCDCHAITPQGKIKAHYKIGENLPNKLSICRKHFQEHQDCIFIEIYSDCLVAINKDSTSMII